MTQTLTTKQINAIASGEFDACSVLDASVSMARELLRYREAAETPSCWEIAGQLFTTKEEALKPGYVGTPEPLYDGPVLEANREAQPVGFYTTVSGRKGVVWHNGAPEDDTAIYTAPPAPAVTIPGKVSCEGFDPKDWVEARNLGQCEGWNAYRAELLAQPVSQGYKLMPVEPTKEMIDAGWRYFMGCKNPSSKGIYAAMLAAAPEGGNEK